jgi:hypothetical protein
MTGHRVRRVGLPRGCRPRGAPEAGFLLPLASTASFVLLLGCLSLQTLTLQNAHRLASLSRLRVAEDQLMSSAQHLVALLQSQHRCLLTLALDQWSTASCVSPAQLPVLAHGEVQAVPYQLVGWQPLATTEVAPADPAETRAELLLELKAANGQPALRSAFAVALQGTPPQVRDLRLLGLRGTTP